jgi:hypothetical protein
MPRTTQRNNQPTGKAGHPVIASGESRRQNLRYSFTVLHIRLSPLLDSSLRFIQMRYPRTAEGDL